MFNTNTYAYSLHTRLKEPCVFELLEPRKGDFILDLGCGVGYFVAQFSKNGARGCGIDFDLDSLRDAKNNTQGLFLAGSATAIPFNDNAFKKILLTDVIEHIEDVEEAISELCRVADNQAVVVITSPCLEGLLNGTRLNRLFHNKKGTPEYHFRDGYTLEELKRLLERHNIKVTEVRYSTTFLGEVFMEITKLVLSFIQKDFTSQASIQGINNSFLFKIYRYFVFPAIYGISRAEDILLSKLIKGHHIIVKGVVCKEVGLRRLG